MKIVLALAGAAALAQRLAAELPCACAPVHVHRFPDGEQLVRIDEPVAGRSVVLVAALDRPDDKLLPLLFAIDLVREQGAARVGLVAPYLPYMRQDQRFHPGEALTSRSFAALLSQRLDFLVTVEPHLHRWPSLQALYAIPAHAVDADGPIAQWIARQVPDPLIIGPDAESLAWVSRIAARLDAPSCALVKTRLGDREVTIAPADLPARGTPVLVDDIISTGRTLVAAAQALRAAGRPAGLCVCVHALPEDGATQALAGAGLRLASCDSIDHPSNAIALAATLANDLRQLALT